MRYPEFREAWERVMVEREVRAAGVADALGTNGVEGVESSDGAPSTIHSSVNGPPPRAGEELIGCSSTGVRLGRGAVSRWSKGAEEAFLEELTASANVARAAAAAGFSAAAIYKRKVRDKHFSAGWDAAIAVGRARLEAHLLVAAERSFDPEGLRVAEGAPTVSVTEAISILKHKPAGAGAGSEWECNNQFGMSKEDVAALREKIIDKLRRVKERDDRNRAEEGWSQDGEIWIPPGWVRAQE